MTKLVPYLRAVEECVDVPQEVCGVSRVDPVKKKRPSIQWWCVDPEQPVLAASTVEEDPEQPVLAASTAEEDPEPSTPTPEGTDRQSLKY